MVLDSLDDLDAFDCLSLVPQCSHGNIIVTSTVSHAMDVLEFQGLEIHGLDNVHGCEMLLSGVGVEASSDKGMWILESPRGFSDLGHLFRNPETNSQGNERGTSSNRTS